MNQESLKAAALALAQARATRTTCERISERFDIQSLEDAYAVQQLGVDQPDFGMLFTDMECRDGDPIDSQRLIQPKAEGEVAFVLGRDLPHCDTTLGELLRAVDHVLPALEIVDSAITAWNITLVDTVADNASSGLYVLGKTPVSLAGLDLALEGMLMEKNGAQVTMGLGAACMGNPLDACLWLARTMALVGRPLQAGDVLLSGALGPMVPVFAGDSLRLRLTRLGEVSCHFV
jgi:2-keto-4-pentenoate hydratase